MTIYTKQHEIESFPASTVFRREMAPGRGYVEITRADILGVKHPRGFYRQYTAGSVASYAIKNNECPMHAVEQAKAKGHALHWINANGSMLTSHERPRTEIIEVTIGMVVRFEGLIATIESAPNDNLRFAPATAA